MYPRQNRRRSRGRSARRARKPVPPPVLQTINQEFSTSIAPNEMDDFLCSVIAALWWPKFIEPDAIRRYSNRSNAGNKRLQNATAQDWLIRKRINSIGP